MTTHTKTDNPALTQAKQRLDTAIERLQQPSTVRQWRFWHGPEGTVSETDALHGDLSSWQEVITPVGWSTAAGETWLRTTITMPEQIEEIPVAGQPVEILAGLPVKSQVYVDGRVAAAADWWLDARVAPIPLADAVQPGQSFTIAAHVPQGDGLGGFGGVALRYAPVDQVIGELELLRGQLVFSHMLAQKSGDAARLAAWEQAVDQLPWEQLEAHRWAAWKQGAQAVVARLAALTPDAKQYRVHAAAHAHIDMNWLWPWEDTVKVIERDFATMDKLMTRYPDFHFSQSQASTYWAMEKNDPALLERVAERVREGRWEVTANSWVENDLNMSSGEATAHHFLYTRRYMQQLFGLAPRLVWSPDTFGHPATMPQMAVKGGAEYYYFCRGGKRYPLFWWEAPDGSRVLGFQDLHWYLGELLPRVVADSAVELAEQYDLRDSLVVYGAGDHGGGATIRDIEAAHAINAAPCLPSVQLDSVIAFFDAVKAANPEMPVVRGELNPVFAGCYTSHADIKVLNRTGETALLDAETLATLATMSAGAEYPQAALEQNWRDVLFQQFHDILCGCGIGLTSKTAHSWAEPAIERTREISRQSVQALAARLDLGQGRGPRLVVLNSLPWSRTDIVSAAVDWECAWVQDDQGKKLPAQRVGDMLLWMAEDVPALGCRVYRPGDATPLADDASVVRSPAPLTLENEYLRFTVDARSGAISVFEDKETGRDLTLAARSERHAELETNGALNRLQIWWEQPHGMSAWKIGDIAQVDHLVKQAEVALVESGPVRGMIEVRKAFLHSTLVQRIVLYRRSRRVDFETVVEWHERGSAKADAPMLRVRFEPTLGSTDATFQIPFGALQRPADGQEVVAQMWGDLSERDGGYGVALLNNCKYGYQAQGNTLGLTLIRASYEPDRNPDEGRHAFTYAFYPHPGSWQDAGVERRAHELNRPLWTQLMAGQGSARAALRPGVATLTCTPESVQVSAVKRAEDGDGVVVRLVELHGKKAKAQLQLVLPIGAAEEVSLAEEPVENNQTGLSISRDVLSVVMQPYEIRTLRLRLA